MFPKEEIGKGQKGLQMATNGNKGLYGCDGNKN